jgi:peptidoglycan/xylan/chitin deacetylase (PgdA/CDA1 family)
LTGGSPADLARALEYSPLTDQLHDVLSDSAEEPMVAADIRRLHDAGMTIGFHTLRHPRLSDLSGADLERAMTDGRPELAAAVGAPVDLLAYPYGRAIRPTAEAAERAGFRAAFASGGHPVSHLSDPFVLGRWDPGAMPADEFAAAVTLRLLRPATARPRRSAAQTA